MKKHKHLNIEIITRYFKKVPAQVTVARCVQCKLDMPEVQKLFQEREDSAFELMGKRSPVVWLNDVPERIFSSVFDAEDPRLGLG